MKVLVVSFFNEESYGVRSLHSNLISNNIDAYMMFFKLAGKYYNLTNDEKHKKSFIGDDNNNATDEEIDLFVDFIIKNKFDVIGFSLVSSHFNMYKRIYEKIKDIKGLTIICGGWQISLNPDESIRYADYICIGEGEDAFLEIITKLDKNESLENINNFWRNENGEITKNDVRPLSKDLSLFPIPVFEHKYSYFVENNELVNYELYFDNTRYGTFIGRGCPFKCTYCSNSSMTALYPNWSKARHRSIEHVKSEMIVLKEKLKNVKSINFYDEVFSPSMDWIKEFFNWYRTEVNIPFFCFFFPGTCSDEKCEVLANAGMKGVWIGIQSGSQRVRKEVFKRFYSNKKLLEQCHIFHKHGVNVRYDFILDNPFETFEESLESIYLMLELPQPYSMNLFSLKYFPNTQIAQMAIDAGIITENDLDDNQEEDKDSYLISKSANSDDDIFINRLALYISYHSNETFDDKFKNSIIDLIEDYKENKDISGIISLVENKIE